MGESVRSESEIREEIDRVESYLGGLDVDVTTDVTSEYLEGLKYALGEMDVQVRGEAPDEETVAEVVAAIQEEFPDGEVSVYQRAHPPKYGEVTVKLTPSYPVHSATEVEKVQSRMKEITFDICDDDEVMFTSLDRK